MSFSWKYEKLSDQCISAQCAKSRDMRSGSEAEVLIKSVLFIYFCAFNMYILPEYSCYCTQVKTRNTELTQFPHI